VRFFLGRVSNFSFYLISTLEESQTFFGRKLLIGITPASEYGPKVQTPWKLLSIYEHQKLFKKVSWREGAKIYLPKVTYFLWKLSPSFSLVQKFPQIYFLSGNCFFVNCAPKIRFDIGCNF